MLTTLWQLPGPSRFVENVVADLQDGCSVVLCLPETAPNGLANALRAQLRADGTPHWSTIDLTSVTEKPLTYLLQRFSEDLDPSELHSIPTLLALESFAGRILWITGISDEHWSEWRLFLEEYDHASRTQSLLTRTIFCVPLVGKLALTPPVPDICLNVHRWENVLDSYDMMMYVANLLREKEVSGLKRRYAVSIISRLALWDVGIAEKLAGQDIQDLFNPSPALYEIAAMRGWEWEESRVPAIAWAQGKQDTFESRSELNSAYAILGSTAMFVQKRIWDAQVGVMLPFVEEQRREILARVKPFLTIPFITRNRESITDYRDLEIGHIESQLRLLPDFEDNELRRRVSTLREIRNCLSHLDPLSVQLLERDEIWNCNEE